MLAFLLPVEEEHVLEQRRQLAVGIDALAIMQLGEQLDMKRQRQHRPRALAQHRSGDGVGIGVEAIAGGQDLADHRLDPAEQRLVLQLLVAEADQRLERDLVADPVVAAHLQHLRVDEALGQAEHIGVGTALDLAHRALLVGRQGGELGGEGKSVRQELVRGIEAAAPDDVLVDVPAHPLGHVDAARVAVGIVQSGDRVHLPSPVPKEPADALDGPAG